MAALKPGFEKMRKIAIRRIGDVTCPVDAETGEPLNGVARWEIQSIPRGVVRLMVEFVVFDADIKSDDSQ